MSLLSVQNLSVSICGDDGVPRELVNSVSFDIQAGQTLGLVGESGCGKSLTAMAVLDLLPKPQAMISKGAVRFKEEDLRTVSGSRLRQIRGKNIAVIFQDPMTALNPVQTVAQQIIEVLRIHFPKQSRINHHDRALTLLKEVGIPAPEERLAAYPHQLSGGMRQRVMIAMALACEPDLLIADEPTTALDVTIQAQIVRLLKKLQKKNGMAMLFITHDLALVSQVSDHIAVMYAGKISEYGSAQQVFSQPGHPYTKSLMAALPSASHLPKSPLFALEGQVPAIEAMPPGCRFANRCHHVVDICHTVAPSQEKTINGTLVSCHRWKELIND
ncbi:Dipeptide transport ATP-binding protein DppD [Zhongshania aliphaticivorans]|uniref:Dipeptide transport ATP-binding protein DppD n=1 Tax=Zhongshania aliphaticivorans TaxID=1470434 RepID=A0A5S9NYF2_9GAMM|nr:ABC transporter ATP-binding protein [Zhongshania aliphaticivorans]CAA0089167.1 Dipeptide transport ATP-binding protein DppD [Zhongshania aliphaticivorans]CAA0095836.1 Dipeptide transport ATP-binding protein DppD [Zhongshania aliphaticivorans]